jgi:hypothetical protein
MRLRTTTTRKRSAWRRRPTVRRAPYVPYYRDAPCVDCQRLYRWFRAEDSVCEDCQLRRDGHESRGAMPDGSRPRLYRGTGGTVKQMCTAPGCTSGVLVGDLSPVRGRCHFCSIPAEVLTSKDGAIIGRLTGAGLLVPDGFGNVRLQFAMDSERLTVPVVEQEQDGRMRDLQVSVYGRPRFGTGWLVLDQASGEHHFWLTNWDSSG